MDESTGGGAIGSGSTDRPTIVDAWLEPLPGSSCGEDLEYDDDFREMEKAAAGRPPSQFELNGVPPDWRAVLNQAQALFERTRDLRVAIYWTRARVRTEGAATLDEGLRLVHGLLDRYWDELHPQPDEGDAYARINALNDLSSPMGLLGDLRESFVINDRGIGELRGRDVEVALGSLEPRSGESPQGRGQIEEMVRAAAKAHPELRQFPSIAVERIEQLKQLMRDRVGYAAAPEFKGLVTAVSGLRNLMPADEGAAQGTFAGSGAGDAPGVSGPDRFSRAGLTGAIDSRADALRAIDMVCEYLERTEPTNPAQLLLRRARRLVNKNFVELVRELAPESLGEVARVMGISADELSAFPTQE
jgi:type VI secretion system protein ImpA